MSTPWVGGAANAPGPQPLPLGALPKPSYPSSEIPGETHNFDPATAQPAANGNNPYSGAVSQDQQNMNNANSALAALPGQLTSKLNGFQAQLDSLASSYPSFQNASGLGSGVPYGQPAQPDAGVSHGFNPWSLRGEALSR